ATWLPNDLTRMTRVQVPLIDGQVEHRSPEAPNAFQASPPRDREEDCRARRAQGQKGWKKERLAAVMLHEFITSYRDPIIARTREKLTDRPWPLASTSELEHGVPLFLTQLSETLRLETTPTPFSQKAIGVSAAKHGRELRALGFNISQVVHDYGDICQAITELAVEQQLPITTEEFRTLNRCLDTAIAEAVTEHARITADSRSTQEMERHAQLAHEIRDILYTALLAFHTLKRGTAAINGSTGTVLSRGLMSLRDLVDNNLSDVRMAANIQRSERVPVANFFSEIAMAGNLHAENHAIQFS